MKEISVVHLGKHYFPDFGGIETATRDLAEAGVGIGCKVECLVTSPRASFGKKTVIAGVVVRRLAGLGKIWSAPIAPGFFLPRKWGTYLLHVHVPNPLAELSALWQSVIFGRRCQLVPFFHAFPLRQGAVGKFWFRLVTRPLLKRAKRITVSSQFLIRAFPQLAEFEAKIKVLPFVAMPICAAENQIRWRQKRDGRTVLMVGRLVPYKGISELLDAWRIFSMAHSDFRLVIIGNGPLSQLVKAEAARAKSGLRWIPECSEAEKIEWFAHSSLFVLPSRDCSETFGIAALEAMAQGLPLLTTDLPTALSSLARGGACGAVVKAGDSSALESGLRRLLVEEAALLPRYGAANLQFVKDFHSPICLQEAYRRTISEIFPGHSQSQH